MGRTEVFQTTNTSNTTNNDVTMTLNQNMDELANSIQASAEIQAGALIAQNQATNSLIQNIFNTISKGLATSTQSTADLISKIFKKLQNF
jgi:hypothetical protein